MHIHDVPSSAVSRVQSNSRFSPLKLSCIVTRCIPSILVHSYVPVTSVFSSSKYPEYVSSPPNEKECSLSVSVPRIIALKDSSFDTVLEAVAETVLFSSSWGGVDCISPVSGLYVVYPNVHTPEFLMVITNSVTTRTQTCDMSNFFQILSSFFNCADDLPDMFFDLLFPNSFFKHM